MTLQAILAENAAIVDAALKKYIPPAEGPGGHIPQAMLYMLGAGKRIRPLVVMRAAQTFGLCGEEVLPTACAYELLHTATLIHDDLPCIDDSPLRRGRASCHVQFDEATAVLAGDALIVASYAALADQARVSPAELVLRVIAEFSAGVQAVIAGEAADVRGEQLPPDEQLLQFIHLNKTAALFVAAARAGAILAGAAEDQIEAIGQYARTVGLLFQSTDDMLDATGDAAKLGKPTGADATAGKQTYPGVYGLEETRRRIRQLQQEASQMAAQLPAEQDFWLALPELLVKRQS